MSSILIGFGEELQKLGTQIVIYACLAEALIIKLDPYVILLQTYESPWNRFPDGHAAYAQMQREQKQKEQCQKTVFPATASLVYGRLSAREVGSCLSTQSLQKRSPLPNLPATSGNC